MKKPLEYIKSVVADLLAICGGNVVDFSEPYIFNCPPSIRDDLYLTKIIYEDGVLSFEGMSAEDGYVVTISESDVEESYLQEIADWFADEETYDYILRYFKGEDL